MMAAFHLVFPSLKRCEHSLSDINECGCINGTEPLMNVINKHLCSTCYYKCQLLYVQDEQHTDEDRASLPPHVAAQQVYPVISEN